MACTNGNCQRVNACSFYKFCSFFWVGVSGSLLINFDVVLNAGKLTKFSFYNNAVGVSIFNNFLCKTDIFLRMGV